MEPSIWDTNVLLGKVVNTGLILAFFGAIVLFLRYLYGPKGKFRDPKWDEWNTEFRREEERKKQKASSDALRNALHIASGREMAWFPPPAELEQAFVDAFFAYSGGFVSEDASVNAHLALKEEHTGKVLGYAAMLAREEADLADPVLSRALLQAALFHDVGRFEQFSRYRTFSDAHSCNHGTLGAKVIRAQGFLQAEPREVQRLALAAVAAHNRLSVPEALGGPLRPVLLAVRDADKLDILRVMESNLVPGKIPDKAVLLHLKDEPESFSPAVLDSLVAGRTALYRDMRYFNDFRILLVTWLYDLHFAASRRIVFRERRLEGIVDGLEALPKVQAQARAVLETMGGRA